MPHPDHGALESGGVLVLLTVLALTALVYVRGWLRPDSTAATRMPAWRAGSFLLGLFSIWVAMASPLAAVDHESLTVHMIQHLLLMTVAAPCVWLGAPVVPLLLGLPRPFVGAVARPLFRWPPIHRLGRTLAQPALCWLAATVTLVGWHVPAAFTLGLQSEAWHLVQQGSFLGTGLLFWWPVIQPWPSVSRPGWSTIVYLFLAMLPCDILSGFLVFSERVAYPIYLSTSGRSGLSVLDDQQCAGALMWTVVTIVYLVAGTILSTRLLSASSSFGDGLVQSKSTRRAALQEDPQRVEVVS